MKKISLICSVAATFVLAACNTDSGSDHKDHGSSDTTHSHHDHGGHDDMAHYTCPMHPEVMEHAPGECPKCGMDLVEHHEENQKNFRLDYSSKPADLTYGQSAEIIFTPRDVTDEKAMVSLEDVHEKKIHLIIVNEDMSYFDHVHPEYSGSGNYRLKVLGHEERFADGPFLDEIMFPGGGNYIMFADYKPDGAPGAIERIPISVQGKKADLPQPKKDQENWKGDGYTVNLSSGDGQWQSGKKIEMQVNITKNGKAVTDIQKYLGANGHLVVISEDTRDYLHVHPHDHGDSGPTIHFETFFEKKGIYRAFLQFRHQGKIQTADFTINVT